MGHVERSPRRREAPTGVRMKRKRNPVTKWSQGGAHGREGRRGAQICAPLSEPRRPRARGSKGGTGTRNRYEFEAPGGVTCSLSLLYCDRSSLWLVYAGGVRVEA